MLILPIFDPSLFHKKATNIFSENCTFVSRIAKAEHLESINVFYPLNAQPKEKNEKKEKERRSVSNPLPTQTSTFSLFLTKSHFMDIHQHGDVFFPLPSFGNVTRLATKAGLYIKLI